MAAGGGAVSRSATTLDRPWQASPGSCAPHAHPTCSCLAVPPVLLPHQVSPPRAAHWISLLPFVPMKLPRVFHAVSRFILDNSCAKRTIRPSPENLEKQVTQNTIAPLPPSSPLSHFTLGDLRCSRSTVLQKYSIENCRKNSQALNSGLF